MSVAYAQRAAKKEKFHRVKTLVHSVGNAYASLRKKALRRCRMAFLPKGHEERRKALAGLRDEEALERDALKASMNAERKIREELLELVRKGRPQYGYRKVLEQRVEKWKGLPGVASGTVSGSTAVLKLDNHYFLDRFEIDLERCSWSPVPKKEHASGSGFFSMRDTLPNKLKEARTREILAYNERIVVLDKTISELKATGKS